MKITFTATEFGSFDDGTTLICGASNSPDDANYHYVTLQRSSEPDDEESWGIHFEIDDQINGNYDLLKSCICSPQKFVCILHKGTNWYPGLNSVEVFLPDSSTDYHSLADGLRRMFRDRIADLTFANVAA